MVCVSQSKFKYLYLTYFEQLRNSNDQINFKNTLKHLISYDGKENVFAGDNKA